MAFPSFLTIHVNFLYIGEKKTLQKSEIITKEKPKLMYSCFSRIYLLCTSYSIAISYYQYIAYLSTTVQKYFKHSVFLV